MSEKKRSAQEMLDRLADILAEDILAMTDQEISEESVENNVDVDAAATRVRNILSKSITHVGKSRMLAARKAYEEVSSEQPINVFRMPLADKIALIERVVAHNREIGAEITMAARSGGEETENDVDAILKALHDLGAIDDEGNPK